MWKIGDRRCDAPAPDLMSDEPEDSSNYFTINVAVVDRAPDPNVPVNVMV